MAERHVSDFAGAQQYALGLPDFSGRFDVRNVYIDEMPRAAGQSRRVLTAMAA